MVWLANFSLVWIPIPFWGPFSQYIDGGALNFLVVFYLQDTGNPDWVALSFPLLVKSVGLQQKSSDFFFCALLLEPHTGKETTSLKSEM